MKEVASVGIVGLGKMGMPMARMLRERGFSVAGYDVTAAALKAAAAAGVQPLDSPKAVAAASDLTIVAVGFDSEVEAVLVGDAGYCVSPVAGMGGSMAIIGAGRIADALQRHGTDHAAARCGDRLRVELSGSGACPRPRATRSSLRPITRPDE